MNYLQAASILIPELIHLPVNFYTGKRKELDDWEAKYSILRSGSSNFNARSLEQFFARESSGRENRLFALEDFLQIHLLVFFIDGRWVMLGPYTVKPWSEAVSSSSKELSTDCKLFYCSQPCFLQKEEWKAADSILRQMEGHNTREICTRRFKKEVLKNEDILDPLLLGGSADVIRNRFYLENRFLESISAGDEPGLSAFCRTF